jgi:hypothetical protein
MTAHTVFLRKELLRRLGYKIPAMKYLSQINIKFPDALTRDMFLKIDLPTAAEAATTRWCHASQAQITAMSAGLTKGEKAPCTLDPSITNTDPLTLTFQDVIAMDPTPYYYNVAMDPPAPQVPNAPQVQVEPEILRVTRSLAWGYGLVDLDPESVNQFNEYLATVSNGNITFTLPMEADFEATVDDSLWMVRKILSLTRADFQAIVDNSYFPEEVSQVVVEKLIARRNSLLDTFSEKTLSRDPDMSDSVIPTNLNLTLTPHVKNGRVLCLTTECETDFPTYATQFAHTDPASPLKGLSWYLLSDLESNAMSNLMDKVNTYIPSLNADTAFQNHQESLFQQAVENYLTKGTVGSVTFGAWIAPVASGTVSINRSVVLGDYMGTSGSDLVQLADTFSFTGNVGMIVGFDGIPSFAQLQGQVLGSATINLTHLKPLGNLKQSVTEPLQNEFVAWLYEHAGRILNKASKEPEAGPSASPSQSATDEADLKNELATLTKYLAVGESLILTESVSGTESMAASVQAAVPASPSLTAQLAADQLVIRRIHFSRVDDNKIQVFMDNGDLYGIDLTLSVGLGTQSADFPLLTLDMQANKGKAEAKIYSVGINPQSTDPTQKLNTYATSRALAQALRTGSLEILESLETPIQIATTFKTSSKTFDFLHYVHRTLKGNGEVTVKLPDGTTGKYLSLNDGVQSGANYQNLAQQAATFVVQQLTKSGQYSINTQASSNPGQSFLGHSQTRTADFEAQLLPALSTPYVGVQYRWEGFNDSVADTQKVVNALSTKYGFKLYPDDFLSDTKDIKLYDLTLNVAIYTKALQNIGGITPEALKALEKEYGELHRCDDYPDNVQTMASGDAAICSNLQNFESDLAKYRKQKNPTKQAQALFETANDLEKFASFSDFVQILGGANNIFVSSTLNGFREGSETLSTPISSNTFGLVDPVNPSGVLDSAQSLLGIDSGEFDMEWIRNFL